MNPKTLARTAGLLYVAQLVLSGFSQMYVRPSVLVAGDPTATADKIRSSAELFRLGLVTDLAGLACFLFVGVALYMLLRSVSGGAATAMVALVSVGVAVGAADLFNHAAALVIATGGEYATAMGDGPRDALAYLFANLYNHGYHVAQVFYGLWLIPAGYLLYRSGWFPKALGALIVVGGLSILAELVVIYSSAAMIESDLAVLVLVPGAIAEIALMFWLAVMGANASRNPTANVAPVTA